MTLKLDKGQKRGADREKEQKKGTQTTGLVCPKCGCDYMIPLMRIWLVKSFVGNRMQVEWPSRENTNDHAVVACPGCCEILKIDLDGNVRALNKKLGADGKSLTSTTPVPKDGASAPKDL